MFVTTQLHSLDFWPHHVTYTHNSSERMNTAGPEAQSLSPMPCSLFTDGTVPQNSHTKWTDTVSQNVTDPPENRVKCNESR